MKAVTLVLVGVLGMAGVARAQAVLVPKDETLAGASEKDVAELNPSLGVTGTVSLVSNSNVVGQVDGLSTLVGLGVVGGLDYVKNQHVLRTTLSISESVARTPVIDEFVKTNDVVALEGLYNYFLAEKLGAYARLKIETAAFAADDVRGDLTSWVEKPGMEGGPPIPLTQNGLRQRLADPFSPFTLSESVGGFAEPITKDRLTLSVRFGLGGRHTFADGVLLVDDDDATTEVELLRLANVHQLGVEAFAGAAGKFKDGKVSYKAGLSLLVPFANNDDYDRGAGELTRVGFEGALTFNLYSWLSVVYSLNVTRDPQLFPDGGELTQVQNNLLLTFQFALVEKKAAAQKMYEEEQKLADAEKRAADAEAARLAAEQRALALEQQLKDAEAQCAEKCATTPPSTGTTPVAPPPPPAPPSPTTPTTP
jgi:hypothetical protein